MRRLYIQHPRAHLRRLTRKTDPALLVCGLSQKQYCRNLGAHSRGLARGTFTAGEQLVRSSLVFVSTLVAVSLMLIWMTGNIGFIFATVLGKGTSEERERESLESVGPRHATAAVCRRFFYMATIYSSAPTLPYREEDEAGREGVA